MRSNIEPPVGGRYPWWTWLIVVPAFAGIVILTNGWLGSQPLIMQVDPVKQAVAQNPAVNPEQQYVEQLTGHLDDATITPTAMVAVGHTLCDWMRQGFSYQDAQTITEPFFSGHDLSQFVVAAITYLCPVEESAP